MMWKTLLAALTALLLLCPPAHAQQDKSSLNSEVDTYFPDNTVGAITPGKLRTVFKDVIASYVDWLTCTGTGGVVYWSAGTPTCLAPGTTGQVMTMSGTTPSWASFASNLVAGTGITITGTSPATISLTNQITAGGPVGSATTTPVITYNAQGQLTAVSSVTTAPPFSNVTGQIALSQLPTIANNTVLGNVSGGASTPTALTSTQITTLCNLATTSLPGCVPAWPNNTTTFFRGDGTYAAVAFSGLTGSLSCAQLPTFTGDVTNSSCALTIGAGKVTNSMLASVTGPVIKGKATSGAGAPTDISVTALAQSLAPDATNDMLLIWDSVANDYKKINPATIASASVAGVSSIAGNTGAFTLSTGITNSTNDIRLDKATAANTWAATSNKALTADVVFNGAGAYQSPTGCGTATITPNFDAGFNFDCTLVTATNFTLANPSGTVKPGQMGCMYFQQPASGTAVTITFGSNWYTSGGVSGKTLTATLGAVDRLCYSVRNSSFIDFTLANNITH